ncbi:putative cytochrome P450 [Massarina eburnea CBS 473.64]|uniref:Putative cytochrome P450 n=1 Tax=Massarina eburnea CBS 473.64 TaxID=1395130 RepID=A0A6A6SFF0_9PLEO|nr:putative cytochrome P450 [Massarina eburnea CBS 473.64]
MGLPQASKATEAFLGKSNSLAVLAIVAALFVIRTIVSHIALYTSRRRYQAEHGCEPVVSWFPTKWFGINFIMGNAKDFGQHRYLESLTEQHRRLGATHGVHALGAPSFWTIEPENFKAILATNFKDYSNANRPAVMGPLLGNSIFVSDGESWSHSRALLRPNFAKDQVADLPMIETHMKILLQMMSSNNATIDLQELIHRFTLDSSTEFLFGQSAETLTSGANDEFSEAFAYSLHDIARGLRLGPFAKFSRSDPKALKSHQICRAYVDNYVQQALDYRQEYQRGEKDPKDRRTFLRELALATDDREMLRDELLSLLLAGRDTTASLIGSLLFALAKEPQVWEKVRQEINDVLKGELPTYDQLRELKYARHCLHETLRLYPPVPTNAKMAVRDTILPRGGGPSGDRPLFVPKGSPVIFTVFAMHRRTDIFGHDAEQFKPERWEDNKRHIWEYLPFNGGPRICLGQQYAMTEALYFLARFAQEFETMESRDPLPWVENLTITTCSFNGVKVGLRRPGEG